MQAARKEPANKACGPYSGNDNPLLRTIGVKCGQELIALREVIRSIHRWGGLWSAS